MYVERFVLLSLPLHLVIFSGKDIGSSFCVPKRADGLVSYIDKITWTDKLKDFRRRIGCSSYEVQLADTVGSYERESVCDHLQYSQAEEQWLCGDRCVEGGISYKAALFFMLILSLSFILTCA